MNNSNNSGESSWSGVSTIYGLRQAARFMKLRGYGNLIRSDFIEFLDEYAKSDLSSSEFNESRCPTNRNKFLRCAKNKNYLEAEGYMDRFTPVHLHNNDAFLYSNLCFFETLVNAPTFDKSKFEKISGHIVTRAINKEWDSKRFIQVFEKTGCDIETVDVIRCLSGRSKVTVEKLDIVFDLLFADMIILDTRLGSCLDKLLSELHVDPVVQDFLNQKMKLFTEKQGNN